MKKIRLQLICFVFSIALKTIHAQTNDVALLQRVNRYLEFSQTMQVDSILNCIYPRLFEIAPKTVIRNSFVETFTDTSLNLKFDSLAVKNMQPVEKFSKGFFSKFTYTGKMLIRFNDEGMQDSTVLQQTKNLYQLKFGKDKVVVKKDGTFEISTTETVVAIKDNYSRQKWTFLSIKKEQQAILKKIIPLEIRNKYKF